MLKDLKALLDLLDPLVLRVHKARPVLKDHKVLKVLLDRKV